MNLKMKLPSKRIVILDVSDLKLGNLTFHLYHVLFADLSCLDFTDRFYCTPLILLIMCLDFTYTLNFTAYSLYVVNLDKCNFYFSIFEWLQTIKPSKNFI